MRKLFAIVKKKIEIGENLCIVSYMTWRPCGGDLDYHGGSSWHDGRTGGEVAYHRGGAKGHNIDQNHKWFHIVRKMVFQSSSTMRGQWDDATCSWEVSDIAL
jgi:hypothetical protein